VVLATALLVPMTVASAQEPDAATAPVPARDLTQIGAVITTLVGAGGTGSIARLQGRQAYEVSADEVAALARERNLDVKAQLDRYGQSALAVTRQEAAFDPVFVYSVRESRDKFRGRTEIIHREREEVIDFEQFEEDFRRLQDGNPNPVSENVCVVIDGVLVNADQCTSNLVVNTLPEFASLNSGKPRDTIVGRVDASKLTRWGGVFNVGLAIKDHEKFGVALAGFDSPFSQDDPLDNDTQYNWSSTFTGGFSSPLPWSRNFGRYGNLDNVDLLVAEQASSSAYYRYGATANTVVADSQRLYWNLVRRALELDAVIRHRETIARRLAKVRREFDVGSITQYELRLAEADHENLLNSQEFAWGEYIKASNALTDLLNLGRDRYLVPSAYGDALQSRHEMDADTASRQALETRPEIKAAAAEYEASGIVKLNREIQTRPDLSLIVSYTSSQSDAVLGYRDIGWSVTHLTEPDRDDIFVGVFYRIPFGNYAVKAARSQAQLLNQQAQSRLEQARIQVAEEVNAALVALYTGRAEVDLTRTNLDLAEQAYASGTRLRDLGNVTEFDLLETFDALLDARLAHIQALAVYQAAHVEVLRAQGQYTEYPQGP
jgi:outer membrane protein TolC